MTVAIVCLLALITITLAAHLVIDLARESRREAIEGYIGHVVVLHLRDEGVSIKGVLVGAERGVALTLAQGEYLLKEATSPIDGRTVIPWGRLDFFQVLTGGDA